jgi:hypothetical protein
MSLKYNTNTFLLADKTVLNPVFLNRIFKLIQVSFKPVVFIICYTITENFLHQICSDQ